MLKFSEKSTKIQEIVKTAEHCFGFVLTDPSDRQEKKKLKEKELLVGAKSVFPVFKSVTRASGPV